MRKTLAFLLVFLSCLALRVFSVYRVLRLFGRIDASWIPVTPQELREAYRRNAWLARILGAKQCLAVSAACLPCLDKGANRVELFIGISRSHFRIYRIIKGHCWIAVNGIPVFEDNAEADRRYLVMLHFCDGEFR